MSEIFHCGLFNNIRVELENYSYFCMDLYARLVFLYY